MRSPFQILQKCISLYANLAKPITCKANEINFILTHPKVGGNTLHSLAVLTRPLSANCFVHNIFTVAPEHMAAQMNKFMPSLNISASTARREKVLNRVERNMSKSKHACEILDIAIGSPSLKKSLNIVSAVREPLACYLSGWYQVLGDAGFKLLSVEEIIHDLSKLIQASKPVNQLHWWNSQVKRRLKFDILEEDFDKKRGWQLYKKEKFKLLVIKQEAFANLPEAFSELYGLPKSKFKVFCFNEGSEKNSVGEDYALKKTKIRFPKEICDIVYDNEWFRAFYTKEDELAFRRQWQAA